MSMGEKGKDRDSGGLPGVMKRFLRGNKGGGGCCGDVRIEEVKEEKTDDKAGTVKKEINS